MYIYIYLKNNNIMPIKFVVLLVLVIYISNSFSVLASHKQPFQSVPDIIRSNGYSAEIHKVHTEDDYILELHRILPKTINSRENAPMVFMHHCLLCSSYEFVANSPKTSLGYILADAGFDVWLANSRGNYYSKNHKTLSPNQKEFWNFSIDEIGLKDLPAGIDYALKVGGQKKLYYVGYSMGSAAIMALLSDKPDYNDKIQFVFLVGPAAYIEYSRGPLLFITAGVMKLFMILGIHEVMPGSVLFDTATSLFCSEPIGPICEASLEQLTGLHTKYITKGLLPTIITHTPAGTSLNNILQFTQAASSGKFRRFDHGPKKNIEIYGTRNPPNYNLKNVKVRTAIFSSEDDWFATTKDVQRTIDELPNVVFAKHIVGEEFSHLDFFWSERAESFIYRDIVKLLRNN